MTQRIYFFIFFKSTCNCLLPPSPPNSYISQSTPPSSPHKDPEPRTPQNPVKKSLRATKRELSWLLTVYELAFLLFRVKEAAQVEDDGQKEHEAGHGDDRHRLLAGEGTIVFPTPQSASHIHLKRSKVPNATRASAEHIIIGHY